MNVINKVWTWFKSYFVKQQGIKDLQKRRVKIFRHGKLHTGAHYYLSDLLEQLDDAFEKLKVLKKTDRHSYNYFSKVSCNVASKDFRILEGNAFSIDIKDIPASGCMFVPDNGNNRAVDDDDEEKTYPTFIYFKRITKPINVQPTNEITLQFNLLLEFKDEPVGVSMYISIGEDGVFKPLKQMSVKKIIVNSKNKKRGQSGRFEIQRATWEYSGLLDNICEDNNWKSKDEYLHAIGWAAINSCLGVDGGITVRVKKRNAYLTFAIDMLRTPYFFKDRKKVVNENGKTKPIFHIVAAHKRKLPNGSEQIVKTHFRGLRRFKWNNYDINIFLGGKHAKPINTYTVSGEEGLQQIVIPEGYIGEKEMGERMEDYFDGA